MNILARPGGLARPMGCARPPLALKGACVAPRGPARPRTARPTARGSAASETEAGGTGSGGGGASKPPPASGGGGEDPGRALNPFSLMASTGALLPQAVAVIGGGLYLFWMLVQAAKFFDDVTRSIARVGDIEKLDTKIEKLDTKVVQLDMKVVQLDTKLGQLDTLVQARLEAALSKWERHVATVAGLAVLGAWLARKPGAGRGAG